MVKNSLKGVEFKDDTVRVASGELATVVALKVSKQIPTPLTRGDAGGL